MAMDLYSSLIVALSFLQVAFGTSIGIDNISPKNGYSFDLQSQATVPPQVNYAFTPPADGNPYTVLVGTGDAGISDGNGIVATITAPQFMWKSNDGSILFTDAKTSRVRRLQKDGTVLTYMGLSGSGYGDDGNIYSRLSSKSLAVFREVTEESGSLIQAMRVSEQ